MSALKQMIRALLIMVLAPFIYAASAANTDRERRYWEEGCQ
jgi:hypothetical protein